MVVITYRKNRQDRRSKFRWITRCCCVLARGPAGMPMLLKGNSEENCVVMCGVVVCAEER
jgi:hypothetical protein